MSRRFGVRPSVDAWLAKGASPAGIAARQQRRLAALLRFVRDRSAFYRQHHADVEPGCLDIRRYPPVSKPLLMDRLDDVVTDPAVTRARVDAFLADPANVGTRLLGRYPVWTTSGTTGEPGIFVQDERALAMADRLGDRWVWQAIARPGPLARLVRHDLRTVTLAVTGGHYAGVSGATLLRRESAFFRHRVEVLGPTRPLGELVDRLQQFQPALLTGYSTVVVELAAVARRGGLDITPAFVTVSAEPITAAEKAHVRDAFGCPVREMYGATEFFPIATECGAGRLHVTADWVVLEPIDAAGRPVPPGVTSETVLVTNLAARVQPLVRYDLGDSVTIDADRCPCGSALPTMHVEGRQGDVLRLRDRHGREVPVFTLALATMVEQVAGVRRAQLVMTAPTSLEVRLDTTPEARMSTVWPAVEQALTAFFQARGVADMAVAPAATPPQRSPGSAKLRHFLAAPRSG